MAEHATMTCDEFLDTAAAAALHAVDLDEVRRVEEHAATCAGCAARLREFGEVAAALGWAVPQAEPPAELRNRLLEAVEREPRTLAEPRRWWPRAARRPRMSPAWLAVAASLVLSFGSLGWVAVLQGQITALQKDAALANERAQRYDHVVEVLASDRLAIRRLQPVVASMPYGGTVYMDPSSGTGMLTCHNLPPVAQGHAYQVWFVRGNERVSGGLLWPDRDGNGTTLIQVPADLQSFESIGLTDEPGTGSEWPTTPKVVGTPLKESDQ